jgi:hypothetical protein
VLRGILPGRSEEVRSASSLRRADATYTDMQELRALASKQNTISQHLHVDFSGVSIPTPPGGWQHSREVSGGSADQAEQYERFAMQREGANFAAFTVKELHFASNDENATNSESILSLVYGRTMLAHFRAEREPLSRFTQINITRNRADPQR